MKTSPPGLAKEAEFEVGPRASEVNPAAGDAEMAARRRNRRIATLAFLAYLVMAVVLFRKGLWSGTARNIGNEFDTRQNMWALEWTPWAISHGHNPLFNDFLNFPHGVNMMWNTPMPLQSLLLWPITASAGPVTSYNFLITLNVVFSAWCGFLALRVFVSKPWPAFAGGLLYGFSPYMMAQSLDHPSLTAAYFPPLLLLLLRQIVVRQERPPIYMGCLLGLWAVAQLLTAEEMLAAQALVSLLAVVVLIALHRREVVQRLSYAFTALGVALGGFLVLAAWPLHFQFFGPQRITGGSVQPPNVFVTDVANLVVPTKVLALTPKWAVALNERWTGNLSESVAYLGVPLILVLAFAIVRVRSRSEVRFASVLGAVIVVLSFGPHLHVHRHELGVPLPWSAVAKVPLLGHILPSRLMLFVFLLIAVIVAVFLDHLPRRPLGWRRLTPGAGLLAVAATLLPDLTYPATKMDIPSFFRDGSAEIIPENSVALVAPFQQLYPAEPMVWQAQSGFRFKMPQGYFFAPDRHGKPQYGADLSHLSLTMLQIQAGATLPDVTPEVRQTYYADLSTRQVETVIVGPMRQQDHMVQFFTSLLGPPLQQFGEVYVWPRVHRLTR